MTLKVFLHGVPDTPAMWAPLISALGLSKDQYRAPALPGFTTPVPAGFTSTKEAYVDWFINELEAIHASSGPGDVVGHDWGALIIIRAASLRPELFRTWTVANALPHPDYKWHRMARMWQTPLLGEIMMATTTKTMMRKALHSQGLPADLASVEASYWSRDMKRAILKLYRSAKHVGVEWDAALSNLPKPGLIFWGEDDPYVPVWVAEAFHQRTGAELMRQPDTGHWSTVERATVLAAALKQHWA